MAWIKWDTCLLPREYGGLDIAPLAFKNRALLAKWWWRFYNEKDSLWESVIQIIYGEDGGLVSTPPSSCASSTWAGILKVGKNMLIDNYAFAHSFKKRIVDGSSTRFWDEFWVGDSSLKDKFNRLFRLETNKDATVLDRVRWEGSNILTSWCWSRDISGRLVGDLTNITNLLSSFVSCSSCREEWSLSWSMDRSFSVKKLTNLLVQANLPNISSCIPTLRNNLVPLKVELVKNVLHSTYGVRFFGWWNLGAFSNMSINEAFIGNGHTFTTIVGKQLWQATEWVTGYSIWKNRNAFTFTKAKPTCDLVFKDIQVKCFEWFSNRIKGIKIVWDV
ncbi:uncharacterized protein [Rutidosis leptorrhynchoides]|uniref:uncharacterized protein n=1 Tax=Rutidosis leptorrhynchoides TaxID=125765 RepID=UPI003A98D38F